MGFDLVPKTKAVYGSLFIVQHTVTGCSKLVVLCSVYLLREHLESGIIIYNMG